MRETIVYNQTHAAVIFGHAEWADELEVGFYRAKRGANSVWRPIAIWHGAPLDPVTGEALDRMWRWNVYYCGRRIDDETLVWPECKKNRIDASEYRYLMARIAHAREYDPRDPYGHKTGQVDWLNSTAPTF